MRKLKKRRCKKARLSRRQNLNRGYSRLSRGKAPASINNYFYGPVTLQQFCGDSGGGNSSGDIRVQSPVKSECPVSTPQPVKSVAGMTKETAVQYFRLYIKKEKELEEFIMKLRSCKSNDDLARLVVGEFVFNKQFDFYDLKKTKFIEPLRALAEYGENGRGISARSIRENMDKAFFEMKKRHGKENGGEVP